MSELKKINRSYLDDFSPDKGFYKILYRPSYAVQARELNQQQTILQNQVKKFGEHIFKDGSIVLGGSFDNQQNVDYIHVDVTDDMVNAFEGAEIVGTTSQVKAKIVHIESTDDGIGNLFYIRYTTSSSGYDKFVAGENVQTTTQPEQTTSIVDQPEAIGTGSLFSISSGTLFYSGYFITFPSQTVVTSKRQAVDNVQIAFKVEFYVVTENDDASLFDNAQGYPNFNAPGAHRLTSLLTLHAIDPTVELGEDYVILARIKDKNVVVNNERTDYSRLAEEFAKRTYDESGDYVVRGMTVYSREHLDTGINGGRLSAANGGDSSLISIGVERGLAYVKGFEVKTNETQYIDLPKSTEYKNVNNQISTVRGSNYFLVNEISGTPSVSEFQLADLYDSPESRHKNGLTYTITPSGTKIGTVLIRTVTTEMENGEQWLRVYVMDVTIDSGFSIDDARAISTSSFFGDIIPLANGSTIRSPATQSLLISSGENSTRTIRSENGLTDTSFSFSRTEDVIINSAGEFSVSTPQVSESFPYGSGTLGNITKSRLILTVTQDADILASGTISCSGSSIVTGTGTQFLSEFTKGERIKPATGTDSYVIKSINSNTEIEIYGTASFTGETCYKKFIIGDIINLSGNGVNGARTVISDTNSLFIDVNEPLGSNVNATITYNVAINEAYERPKTLRPNRYVILDLNTTSSKFKLNLGLSDVLKVNSIRHSDVPFESTDQGTVVTSHYKLNNGQRDLYYDHAYIKAENGQYDSGYLLVSVDYFVGSTSNGIGYYSVDSYPIDDTIVSDTTIQTIDIPKFKSTSDGNIYNLRNFLDFRPSVVNTANDATLITNATVNPVAPTGFVTGSNIISPTPGTQITFDYSYYISRKDIIALDNDGNFQAILGTPAVNPYFPTLSSNLMGVSQVYIPPYPSIASTYARILGIDSKGVQTTRIAHKRYTMRDIGKIDSRVKTLEYYNALNMLEKSASDLTIPDENGLDRFKNGFFVDGYLDHSLGQQSNTDYKIAVDRENQWIRPVFKMEAFNLKLSSGNHANINGNFVTLPWSETTLLEQNKVTTYRNIEQGVFRFIGNMNLDPAIDTWVDSTTIDKTIDRNDLEDDFGITLPEGTSTEWKTWSTSSAVRNGAGTYSAYDRRYGDRTTSIQSSDKLIGSFGSFRQAASAARKVDRRTKIASVYEGTVTKTHYRQAINTTVNVERESEEIGNFITDVSITPYIRPQRIKVYAQGLKANTLFHVFFDEEGMNDYFTPYTIPSDGNIDNATMGTEGSDIRSNEFGEVYGYLRLPENGKRFRIGTKKIRLTDSPTNSVDSTSYAEKNFVASGLETKKQNTIFSTITDASVDVSKGRKEKTGTSQGKGRTIQEVKILGPSCMAYSFLVDVPEDEKGVFLTSVDVFIQSLHPTLGVWFEIREMSDDGGITRNQVPYSEVWMKRDDPRLQTSSDASAATNVNFENPVFLMNDTQYAFVIHTEGLNPDTYFFVSRLGEDDLNSGEQVTGRQLTGTTYVTNNNLNWDIVPDVDLTVKFNRADFDISSSGEFDFDLGDYELIASPSVAGTPVSPGDEVVGSCWFDATNATGTGGFSIGDTITGTTSGATGTVLKIEGTTIFTDSFDLQDGESASIDNEDYTFVVSNRKGGSADVRKVNRFSNEMILEYSNGEFFEGCSIKNQNDAVFELTEFFEYPYYLINFDAGSLPFEETNSFFRLKTVYEDTKNRVINNLDLGEGVDHEFDSLMTIQSKSVEEKNHFGRKSVVLNANFNSSSSYVTPVFDVDTMKAIFVHNILNDDTTGELNPSGGNLINTYISKTIILDERQTAEDFIAYLSVYRPPNSNIYVWLRTKNNNDIDSIENKDWIMLEQTGETNFSSRSNNEDFMEFEYHIPEEYLTGTEGQFQYVSDDGRTQTGYDVFEIKVGLSGQDKVIVPKVSDLRAIALQV